MPAIAHLQARFLIDSSSGGISATAIGLIIGVGLVPALILVWVVVWLLFFYGSNRNCCCVNRKTHPETSRDLEKGGRRDTSQEMLYEKAVYDLPQRPFVAHSRTEPGISSGARRLSKPDPNRPATRVSHVDSRMSVQSHASANTVQGVQEPKRFV